MWSWVFHSKRGLESEDNSKEGVRVVEEVERKEAVTGGGDMTGEEVSGPPGPKMFRLFYFVGAGVICTVAINKWREYERKTIIQQKQQAKGIAETQSSSDAVDIHKPLK